MKRKIVVNHKEYTTPRMGVDTYADYVEAREKIGNDTSRESLELMMETVVNVYGNQFTMEELKDPETGLDVAGIIIEFNMGEMCVAKAIEERMKKIQENFQDGK